MKHSRSKSETGSEPVAVERAYNLTVNGTKITRVFLSPADLEEFALGYLLSEGIVDSSRCIDEVAVGDGNICVLAGDLKGIDEEFELRSSGCVGFRWTELGESEGPKVDSELRISSDFVFDVLEYLDTDLYRITSGSHSAGLIGERGERAVRAVDVGRHNAFDKVIGKAVREGLDLSRAVLLGSGRQSSGMVMKAANSGIPIVISKAAPLSSGIEAARRTGVTLVCFADDQKFKVFSGDVRIRD
ncbi:hypothetical protein AKJ65_01245 [candidate division MSBL1 archaeon SCGC-AAA259E19]|uniref:Sulfur carrier protein FdhD n=1 Tax=candidate division MSBL1 archaeon SCGC-AAA259E19 TaxID=1698264 RepID=A0A133UNG8_9EURY|nr:hypothetical protein AKJ65_01245 [candidate division MSBL1 archaeon SCGC-AAA259E19]